MFLSKYRGIACISDVLRHLIPRETIQCIFRKEEGRQTRGGESFFLFKKIFIAKKHAGSNKDFFAYPHVL